MSISRAHLYLLGLAFLGACATVTSPPSPPPRPSPPTAPAPGLGARAPSAPTVTANLQAVSWAQLPDWQTTDALGAWQAWLNSCTVLKKQTAWQAICAAAHQTPPQDDAEARRFFELWLTPYQVRNADNGDSGLVTGYYEPLLFGSRSQTTRYRFPMYRVPDDLITVDLSSIYPELKTYRLRGRLNGNRVVPYFNRAEIDGSQTPLQGRELLWVDDPVELFFLQIQGSGRVQLENGELVRVGYAEQNGYPYTAIGKKLVEQGELSLDQASMWGIKQWGLRNPQKLPALLNNNASYVFFRELPASNGGPPGALGVPLTGGRSLAVDTRSIALGSPVYLATTWPNSEQALRRLMLAQDTGGAIKGGVRADFFWGFGDEAARQAGAMRQQGQLWVLLPKTQAIQP